MDPATARTRLFLVRHGASRAHDDGVVGGIKGCRGLNETGRAQARALRDRVRAAGEIAPDVVLTSVLPRAIETAEIVGAAFSPAPEPVADCAYCELHPGECDGMTWDDYRDRYGEPTDPDVAMSPGGESLRTFDARVRAATAALLDAYRGRTIVMFTHGGFVSAACCYMLGAPGLADFDRRPFRLEPANTSITEFVTNDDARTTFTLVRYNDAGHLASVPAAS
jgi:probable phosphoglycerate mutase